MHLLDLGENTKRVRGGLGLCSLRRMRVLWLLTVGLAAAGVSQAIGGPSVLTLQQLRGDSALTPERFMRYFHDFYFVLGETRRPVEVFLASRCGDCDDFACLADEVLREKNYTTRLIAVFMPGQTHVVCYVKESHGYLDYNRRRDTTAIQPAGEKLEEVADQVATYFRAPWQSVSEFTYHGIYPRFGRIVFR